MRHLLTSLSLPLLVLAGCGNPAPVTKTPAAGDTETNVAVRSAPAPVSIRGLGIKVNADVLVNCAQEVSSAAFAPGGAIAATGGQDGSVVLWEVATGRQLRSISGASASAVPVVAFSADGALVAAGGQKPPVVGVWSVATGEKKCEFRGHVRELGQEDEEAIDRVTVIRFLDEGRMMSYTAEGDTTARIWNLATGSEVSAHKPGWAYGYGLTEGGRFAVTLEHGKIFRYSGEKYDVVDEVSAEALKSPSGRVWTADAEASVVYVAVTGGIARVSFTDKTAAAVPLVRGKHFNMLDVDVARGRVLSADYEDDARSLVLSDLTDGRELSRCALASHPNAVTLSRGFPVGLVAVDDDIRFISVTDDRITMGQTVGGRARTPQAAALLPSERLTAVVGSTDLTVWDLESGAPLRTVSIGPDARLEAVAVSAEARRVAAVITNTAVGDGRLVLWDLDTWQETGSAILKSTYDISIAFLPGGTSLVLAGGDFLGSYDLADGTWTDLGKKGFWNSLSVAPDGKRILLAWEAAVLWDLATRTRTGPLPDGSEKHGADSVAIAPDGRRAALCSVHGAPRVVDLDTGAEIWKTGEYGGIDNDRHWPPLAWSPNGKALVGGDRTGLLTIYDGGTGQPLRRLSGHSGMVHSIQFTPDGKRLFTSGVDGTSRLWDARTGKEMGRFVTFEDGEWITLTPSGHFAASSGGAKHVTVRAGMNTFAIDNFFERYHQPLLVSQALSGAALELTEDLRAGITPPPVVAFVSPAGDGASGVEQVEVVVTARDAGGGVDQVGLFHNGSALPGATKTVQVGEALEATFLVTLVEGDNTLRAVAWNTERTESAPVERSVSYTGPAKSATLHLLVAGVNEYENPALNLGFAVPDTKAVKDFFVTRGTGLFEAVHVVELYDGEATREGILAKVRGLSAAPADVVIMYLAGHGTSFGEDWFFLPHDCVYPEKEDHVRAKGISAEEIAESVRGVSALKKVVFIDACKSGGVMVAMRGVEDRRALAQLARSTGTHVVAASAANQFAGEAAELGHGIFTYTVLEGLQGKAAASDGRVTVRGLLAFIEDELPVLSKQHTQQAQYPIVDSRGQDFPLVVR